MAAMMAKTKVKGRRFNQLRMGDTNPEKTGVGGSIPSLAATEKYFSGA